MVRISITHLNLELSTKDYDEWINNQIQEVFDIQDEIIKISLSYLERNFYSYKKVISSFIDPKKVKTEKQKFYSELFYEQVDDAYQNIKCKQERMIESLVADTLQLIEKDFPQHQLTEIYQYLDVTERLIIKSFMERPQFLNRKAFQQEFQKAMIIRQDEFYAKYGVTTEYIEGYRRVKGDKCE